MTTLRGRLFWKIYLTLLVSLIAVAVLMGAIWRLVGETPEERWTSLRNQVTTTLVAQDLPEAALQRLAERTNADVSLYRARAGSWSMPAGP